MVNKVIFIGRLGKNAEVKTTQNSKEYVVFSLATSERWKNEKGDYENRTEWHRMYAWSNLSSFVKTLQKGQIITLEGKIKYREVSVEGVTFKHTIAEIHATSIKRLSKVEATNNPADGASEDDGHRAV
jgi:single-strand DNA-binding protein